MARRTGNWSTQELDRLRRLFPRRPAADIARLLQRSESSVRRRARALFAGPRQRGTWTDEDDERLRLSFGGIPDRDLAMVLRRTVSEVRRRARELRERLRRGPWSAAEIRLLKRLYGNRSDAALEVCLQRPASEIGDQARALCLAKDKRLRPADDRGAAVLTPMPRWNAAEERLLRELYAVTPNLEIAARLQRTVTSVANKASQLGLRKGAAVLRRIGRRNVGFRQDRS